MERQLVLNRIKTPKGTILTSWNRHDYKAIDEDGKHFMVDGGLAYVRRGGAMNDMEELSVYLDEPFEKVREAFHRGSLGKEGNFPVHYNVPISKISDQYLFNLLLYVYRDHVWKYRGVLDKSDIRLPNQMTLLSTVNDKGWVGSVLGHKCVERINQLFIEQGCPISEIGDLYRKELQYRINHSIEIDENKSAFFVIWQSDKNNEYYFHLKSRNGNILLWSEGYKYVESAFDTVYLIDNQLFKYEQRQDTTGKWYIVLKAGNGEIIGQTESYASKGNVNKAQKRITELLENSTQIKYKK